MLGICTGSLTAAAVSSSRSLSELVPRAVEAVLVAFGVGMCVSSMKMRLVSPPEMSRTWFIMVAGPSASQAVLKFCEESALPITAKPFISAFTVCKFPRVIFSLFTRSSKFNPYYEYLMSSETLKKGIKVVNFLDEDKQY
jgi:hypothetical protein